MIAVALLHMLLRHVSRSMPMLFTTVCRKPQRFTICKNRHL